MKESETQSPVLDTPPAPGSATRVSFVSLGCPKNLVDSETMLGSLREDGCEIVSEGEDADAIIINTCGFLEASKEESLSVIRDAIARKERGELKRVVVAGCLVQRHRERLLEWAPGIDSMIGVFDRDHVIDAVAGECVTSRKSDQEDAPLPRYWIAANALQAARQRGRSTTGLTVNGKDGRGIGYFEGDGSRFRLTPKHWAYLRVSEGCNQRCAFCTIPSIRGKMRSKPLENILREARALFEEGAHELNLIGQDTTSYGYDIYQEGQPGGDLIGLLSSLNDLADEFGGSKWIRLMYVYPTHFTDDMIDAIAALPNIVRYIDIPLQHMSDRMLTAMRRNITAGAQAELLHKLRERIPGLAIRTTFITGFPGETEADHHELLEFIEEFQFDMMGVFRYSREEGTPAGTMDLDPALHVPDEVKQQREAELMLAQQEIAFSNAAYLAEEGCQFDVLIERPAPAGIQGQARLARFLSRTYFQAPQVDSTTFIDSEEALAPGRLLRCAIVGSQGYDLLARPVAQPSYAAAAHQRG